MKTLHVLPRSWLLCPLLGVAGYEVTLHCSLTLAHEINPNTTIMGLEYFGGFVLGMIGGILVPLTFHAADFIVRFFGISPDTRCAGAFIASLSGAFNSFFMGSFCMIPLLAWFNSMNPSIPYLEPSEFDRYRMWRDAGAWACCLTGTVATFALFLRRHPEAATEQDESSR